MMSGNGLGEVIRCAEKPDVLVISVVAGKVFAIFCRGETLKKGTLTCGGVASCGYMGWGGVGSRVARNAGVITGVGCSGLRGRLGMCESVGKWIVLSVVADDRCLQSASYG